MPIFFKSDESLFAIDSFYLKHIPSFQRMFDHPDLFGSGIREDPIVLDMDKQTVEDIIEYSRNLDNYSMRKWNCNYYSELMENKIRLAEKKDIIQFCVGTKTFLTTTQTLSKLHYFDCIINKFNGVIPKYIDRNGKAFRHVLALARIPEYPFPEKYRYELEYFDIPSSNQIESNWKYQSIPPFNKHCDGTITTIHNTQFTYCGNVYRTYAPFSKPFMVKTSKNTDAIYRYVFDNDEIMLTNHIFFVIRSNHREICLDDVIQMRLLCGEEEIYCISPKLSTFLKSNDVKMMNSELADFHCLYLPFSCEINRHIYLPFMKEKPLSIEISFIEPLDCTISLYCRLHIPNDYEKLLIAKRTDMKEVTGFWKEDTMIVNENKMVYHLPEAMYGAIIVMIDGYDAKDVLHNLRSGEIIDQNGSIYYIDPIISIKNMQELLPKNESDYNCYVFNFRVEQLGGPVSGHLQLEKSQLVLNFPDHIISSEIHIWMYIYDTLVMNQFDGLTRGSRIPVRKDIYFDLPEYFVLESDIPMNPTNPFHYDEVEENFVPEPNYSEEDVNSGTFYLEESDENLYPRTFNETIEDTEWQD